MGKHIVDNTFPKV